MSEFVSYFPQDVDLAVFELLNQAQGKARFNP